MELGSWAGCLSQLPKPSSSPGKPCTLQLLKSTKQWCWAPSQSQDWREMKQQGPLLKVEGQTRVEVSHRTPPQKQLCQLILEGTDGNSDLGQR